MMSSVPLGVALYGKNGHQIQSLLEKHPEARVVAIAEMTRDSLPQGLRNSAEIREYPTLEGLLGDSRVDIVSFCSPRRSEQAQQCIAALRAGKHVYAEKPCALTEDDMDAILLAAKQGNRIFHEMAGTAFEHPYLAMRQIMAAGTLGTVVQVFAQKSYPWHAARPCDEDVDGGLTTQAGVHAVRMIEHVAGVRVASVQAMQTTLGDPAGGLGLRMAAAMLLELENGGVASVIANYLNPRGIGRWGNEELRIFGSAGMLESTDGGTRTRLVVGNEDRGALPAGESRDYFDYMIAEIRRGEPMPLTLEEELHPTRIVLQARDAALAHSQKSKSLSASQARRR